MKNLFNIVVTENYKKDGEDKTAFTTVGTAFYNKDSNSYSCKLRQGIALTGDFVLFERKAKEE